MTTDTTIVENDIVCRNCGHVKETGLNDEMDGCIEMLPGVVDACCGHGDPTKSYIHFQNGTVIRGFTVATPMPPSENIWIIDTKKIQGYPQ